MRHVLFCLGVIGSMTLSMSVEAQQSDQVETYHACVTTDPQSNEVFVYANPNFGGTCAALYIGFYPNPGTGTGTFGLSNDSLSSMKVGSAVRARIFQNVVYGGSYYIFPGSGFYSTMPNAWDNQASSIRIEDNSRSSTCNDLLVNEYSLFRDANYGSDCVVLRYGHTYLEPVNMGIANDAVSSILGGPQVLCANGNRVTVVLYRDGNLVPPEYTVPSGTSISYLSTFNDVTSSVTSTCNVP